MENEFGGSMGEPLIADPLPRTLRQRLFGAWTGIFHALFGFSVKIVFLYLICRFLWTFLIGVTDNLASASVDFVRNRIPELYPSLDMISPSATEAERLRKQYVIQRSMSRILDEYVVYFSAGWRMPMPFDSWVDYCYFAVALLLALFSGSLFIRTVASVFVWCYRRCARKVRSMRGLNYQPESMQAGSVFKPEQIPKFQLKVYIPGMFKDSFNGFGVRKGEFLVVPAHVVQPAFGENVIILENFKGERKAITMDRVSSKVSNDICYIRVEEDVFSTLGCTTAKWCPMVLPGTPVKIVGHLGASSGTLVCSAVTGFYTYSGSTVPGYSGAALYRGNTVFAIHNGSMSGKNTCFSSHAVHQDLGSFMPSLKRMNLESMTSYKQQEDALYDRYYGRPNNQWRAEDVKAKVDYYDAHGKVMSDEEFRVWATSDDWDETRDGQYYDWATESWKPMPASVPVINVNANVSESVTRLLSAQSDEGVTVELQDPCYAFSSRLTRVESKFDELNKAHQAVVLHFEERIKALESGQESASSRKLPEPLEPEVIVSAGPLGAFQPESRKERPVKVVKIRTCRTCGFSVEGYKAFMAHLKSQHPLKKESVNAHDIDRPQVAVKVADAPFLGQRKKSPKRSSRKLDESLISSVVSRVCQQVFRDLQ